MSAYLVGDTTIAKILCGMNATRTHERLAGYVPGWGETLVNYDEPFWIAMGQRLRDLNAEAVGWRYGGAKEVPPFRYACVPPPLLHSYKALTCFLYQCEEGDVPKQELFKALNRIRDYWATIIVDESPEYDAAPWG